ncbi:MAG: Lin1244/Lin1753 domain-containing protein [Cetobacterium sp.]
MARAEKKGLKKFKLDAFTPEDKRIRKLKKIHRLYGLGLYVELLCYIYREDGDYMFLEEIQLEYMPKKKRYEKENYKGWV